ncbi:Hypothetical protein CINCED_3A025626 [Cinara cedri]|uniref:Uncharacterized protein n=1 Tax=Cinara cedri TaxID=506608 RepID=A0A5E4NGM7_9HEMI|nr:Hypothetical protein CINCED_3A025626 [Cinara cedri]
MGNEKETKSIISAGMSFFTDLGKNTLTGIRILAGVLQYIFNPAHWGHSKRRIIHEVKQAFHRTLNKPTKEHNPPTECEPNSNCFGVKLTGEGRGYLGFKVSDTFLNSIVKISDAQIKEVNALNHQNKNFDIVIDRVAKKVIIEIDVEKIIYDIMDDPENKGKIEEEITKLAIGKIIEEADSSLKKLANITGGQFSKYADSQLLSGVGKRLYQSYKKQKDEPKYPVENPMQLSETVLPMSPNAKTGESPNVRDNSQQEEQMAEFFSMTVPRSRLGSYERLISANPGLQIKTANAEDARNNLSNSPPTPNATLKLLRDHSDISNAVKAKVYFNDGALKHYLTNNFDAAIERYLQAEKLFKKKEEFMMI